MQIINPATAQVMINMLKAVVSGGTGGAARPGRVAAGKTGTTNNFKDAWFVGFVPQLTTGIWVGYDKMGLSLGIGQSGGAISAPLWGRYMRLALKNEPVLSFPTYAPLTYKEVCSRSGLLPSSSCKNLIKEGYIPGTVPEKECELCAKIKVDLRFSKKGPRDNISKKQKSDIYKNIRKSTTDSILNNIEDDLLKD
jgi:penicillin-binding protein 1A